MKKFLMTLVILLIPSLLTAQTYLSEDFSGGSVPPAGWSVDAHAQNWHINNGNDAGGTAPEAVFDWSPQFSGQSRLISPEIDLTGVSILRVQFKHMLNHYSGNYTIGVATRSGGGSWQVVWQRANPGGDIPATTQISDINNDDVGASDFQICWFFSGSSYNLDYWYIDDIRVFQPFEHDAMVRNILVESQYNPGAVITTRVVVENFGLNEETFDATCEINISDNTEYSETITSITLEPGENTTITFPSYTASDENELFQIVATTILDGDMDESNDSMVKWFNTYTTEREMVVLEIGTGTWCQFCPGAAMGAEDLVDNGHDVAVVEYHNGDPFANVYSDARNTYYGISGFPTAVFDGVEKFIGGSNNQSMYSNYLPIYQDRIQIKSAFTVDICGENDGNNYDLGIVVNKMATIPWDNLVLHVALTESDIPFNWQGQNHLEWVERLMMPDAEGTPIDMMSNDNLTVNLDFALNSSWVLENCELTAFVQNLDNKEILQGTKVMLTDLTPLDVEDDNRTSLPLKTGLSANYPNPFNPSTTINFTLKETQFVILKVYDMLGREVQTLVNEQRQTGIYNVQFDASELGSGVYFYRMTAGDFNETRKMILVK